MTTADQTMNTDYLSFDAAILLVESTAKVDHNTALQTMYMIAEDEMPDETDNHKIAAFAIDYLGTIA